MPIPLNKRESVNTAPGLVQFLSLIPVAILGTLAWCMHQQGIDFTETISAIFANLFN